MKRFVLLAFNHGWPLIILAIFTSIISVLTVAAISFAPNITNIVGTVSITLEYIFRNLTGVNTGCCYWMADFVTITKS